jgi:predicted RNase H-like nuclease (RuvC/YqgF family)
MTEGSKLTDLYRKLEKLEAEIAKQNYEIFKLKAKITLLERERNDQKRKEENHS